MPLFWIFIILPLLEIFVMIEVGSVIGAGWTVLLVVLTSVLGVALVRRQGRHAMADLQASMEELRDPGRPIAHGALILLAGALLVVPGFLTDIAGAMLLVPPLRDWLLRRMGRRMVVVDSVHWSGPGRPGPGPGGRVIDAEYEVVDDDPPNSPPSNGAPRPPSGWTRQ